MKRKLWILPVLLVITFVAVALLAQVQGEASKNPLAQFYHDGKLTIPGGRLTRELQQLLFPPPAPKNYTTYAVAESAYPTLAWVGTVHDIPKPGPAAPDPAQSVASFFGPLARWWDRLWNPMPDWGAFEDQIRAGAGWLLFGWWTGEASAACTGGTCHWIGGTGDWSQTAHWSLTNGGATCSCTPATTDAVVFDSGSGTGTSSLAAATTVASVKWIGSTIVFDTTSANNWGLTLGGTGTAANTVVFDQQSGVSDFQASTITVYGTLDCTTYPTCGDIGNGHNYTLNFLSSNNQGVYLQNVAYNVTMDSSNTTTSITYTALHNIQRVSHQLTIQDTAGTTPTVTFDLTASNFALNDNLGQGSITIGSRGILNGRASTITVAGNWDSSAGAFTYGTSTVVMAATGTLTVGSTAPTRSFYNVSLAATGTTTTLSGLFIYFNSATLGTGTLAGGASGTMYYNGTNTSPLTNAGATITARMTFDTSVNLSLPAFSTNQLLTFQSGGAGSSTMTMGGTLGGGSTVVSNYAAGGGVLTLATGGNAFTATALTIGGTSGSGGSVSAGNSTVTINGLVQVNSGAFNSLISTSGGSWSVSGTWTNSSSSSSWSLAAPITFTDTSGFTLTPNTSVAQPEFNAAVTFNPNSSSAVTFTLGGAWTIGGALTVEAAGSGTTTLDLSASNLALTVTGLTLGANGILNGRGSTITDSGMWDTSNASATFTYGTSTVVMSGTSSLNLGGVAANHTFYNLNIAASGKTTTIGGSELAVVGHVATLGTGTVSGTGTLYMLFSAGNTAPVVNGGVSSFQPNLTFDGASNVTIPAMTIGQNLSIQGGGSYTATLGGNFVAGGNIIISSYGAGTVDVLNTGGFSLTGVNLTVGTTVDGALVTGASTVSVNLVSVKASAASYITSSAGGAWTVTGSWTNASTSSSWSFAAPITFKSATNQTMTFAGSSLSGSEFAAVTFDTTTAAGVQYTMSARALVISGLLTIQNTAASPSGYVMLNLSVSNLALTSGGVTLSTWGQLNGQGSAITVNGSWDSSSSTSRFTYGTSSVVFAGTASVAVGATTGVNRSFYSLQMAASGQTTTLSGTLIYYNVLTLGTGTVAGGGTNTLYYNGSNATPLTNAGATIQVDMTFDTPTALTIAGFSTNTFCNFEAGGNAATTMTMSGALTCGSLVVANYAGGGGTVALSTGGFAVSLSALTLGSASGSGGIFNSGASAVTIQGNANSLNFASGVGALSYVTSTAGGNWTVYGAWTNNTASSSWSFAAPITFASASDVNNAFALAAFGKAEFSGNVTFNTSATTGTVTFASVGGTSRILWLSGLLLVEGTNGGTTLLTDGGSSAHTPFTIGNGLTVTTGGQISVFGNTTKVSGNWDTSYSSSAFQTNGFENTVEFTGSGQYYTFLGGVTSWNLVVDAGVTTAQHAQTLTIETATINGTLTSDLGTNTNGWIALVVVTGTLHNTPMAVFVTIGPSGSMTGNVFIYEYGGTSATYTIAAGTYAMLQISSVSGKSGYLGGDVTTPQCSHFEECEVLMQPFNGIGTTTLYLNGHSMNIGGDFFVGDLAATAIVHFGTGTITTHGFNVRVSGIVYLESGTLTTYFVIPDEVGTVYSPLAFYVQSAGQFYGGTGTVNVHGSVYFFIDAPDTAFIAAQGMTLNTFNDALSGICNVQFGCPGDVKIASSGDYIDFGTSTWNIAGGWSNSSASASWNAATGTVNFTGSGTITVTTGAITQPEFPTTTVSGTYTLSGTMAFASLTLSGPLKIGGIPAGGSGAAIALTPSSGYATLASWNLWAPGGPNIDFPIHLTAPSATLTITVTNISQAVGVYVNGVYQSRATQSGNQQTMTVPGPWSTQDISITAPPGPGGGGGGGGGGNPPTITIVATPSSDGYTYTFTLDVPTGYTVGSATWDFGDGSTATGQSVTHTFAAIGYAYTVKAQVSLTNGYSAPVTTTVIPTGPLSQAMNYTALILVLGAVILLALVFFSDTETRRILYAIGSLALFWFAIADVAVADFPSFVPHQLFLYLPLAVAATSVFMAAEKANRKKLIWIGIVVAAVVVWSITLAA